MSGESYESVEQPLTGTDEGGTTNLPPGVTPTNQPPQSDDASAKQAEIDKMAEQNAKENGHETETPKPAEEESKPYQRPEWLPEQFESLEQYNEVMKAAEEARKASEEGETDDGEKEDDKDKEKEPESIDLAKYTEELTEKGQLSEDSYKEIMEKTSLPKETIDTYVAGLQALEAQQNAQLYDTVGGQDQYAEVMKWAESNAKSAYDSYFASSSMDQAKLALSGLHAMYTKANGSPPKLTHGKPPGGPSDGVKGFSTPDEYADAINDPRYASSESYRQEVQRRVAVSNIFQ